MAKFVYLYAGGQGAESAEAQEDQMRVWRAWFDTLGDSLVDIGNPFTGGATVTASGTADGTSRVGGYSIVSADSLAEAAAKAKGCPIVTSGGNVEVYEALPM